MSGQWNSIEIATLAVAAVTPLTVAVVGYFVARAGQRHGHVQWANQTVLTRRLEIFNQVAPALNQLLCFATFVGGWKEITPQDAIALKRKVDEIMYTNRVLFSAELVEAYRDFMGALFAMWATTNADAQLRTPIASQWGDRRSFGWWAEDTMAALFSVDNPGSTEEIQATYNRLAERFREDLYVTADSPILTSRA
jgi:hypothetical protein